VDLHALERTTSCSTFLGDSAPPPPGNPLATDEPLVAAVRADDALIDTFADRLDYVGNWQ
jgi:hypothetical protein